LSVNSWFIFAMEDIPSVSPTELAERRRKLRRQRRSRLLQTGWQIFVLGGLTAGLIRVVTLPDWMIRDPSQIMIKGNKTLPPETVRTLLSIHYPQSLLTLRPQEITRHLEAQAPIADVTVTRHLFPPSLTVQIRERYPVAVVYSSAANPAAPKNRRAPTTLTPVALLDEKGTVISYQSYTALNQSRQLPALKVIGNQEQFHSQWPDLYEQVSHSPVKVSEIDWRDPGNMILHTELGTVYLGSYNSQFAKQLQVLDRMRQLPKDVDPSQIAYIDLRNPDTPLLEMTDAEAAHPSKSGADESEGDGQ
jgi:cell division protein FtsQ